MQDPSFYKQHTMHEFSHTSAESPPFPKQIGPYLIESLLHKSRSSLLYLGVHPESKTPVAVKVLSPLAMKNKELTALFIKEAGIISLADHPNIVKLYGEGEWEGKLYIAMEFIQGISLRQFIIQRSLTLRRTLEIVLQTAYALLHLHTHGIIHRDLKPENILIQEDGEVKVVDFGIAQLFNEQLTSEENVGRIIGTPSYMSPEQKENPSHLTYASDIYSLGIIAYELLVGKLSYGLIELSSIPTGLRPILEKTLAPRIEDRYQDIVDLIRDVTDYLKSGKWEKDRTARDQIKEHHESIRDANQMLLSASFPSWPLFNGSLAKRVRSMPGGLVVDFFSFPNDTYLIIIAKTVDSSIRSLLHIAKLQGSYQSLLAHKKISLENPLDLLDFVTEINEQLFRDPQHESFFFQALLLDAIREEMTYIPCHASSLLHLPSTDGEPHYLHAENPLLGKEKNPIFQETIDNWKIGSLLIMHSLAPFNISTDPSSLEKKEETDLFVELIQAYQTVSMTSQANSLLKKSIVFLSPEEKERSQLLLTMQRIL